MKSMQSKIHRVLLYSGTAALMAMVIPHVAKAASGNGACGMLGMFDPRLRAACEMAATAKASTPNPQTSRNNDQRQSGPQTPLPRRNEQARSTSPRQAVPAPAAIPPNGPYRLDAVKGLATWRDAFAKAAHDPAGFAKFRESLIATANSPQAKAQILAYGPKRNDFEKFLTDYDLYKLYNRNAETLLSRQNQCMAPREYSAEETCDCLAGFPGQTTIGPGAGELITREAHTTAIKACGAAVTNATNPTEKARYLAQRSRAQVYTTDPAQAVSWADEAIASGYKRAAIVKAEANLWDIEFLAGGFPPITQTQFDLEMKDGIRHLQEAKRAGIPETYIVAKKYHQMLAHASLNTKIMAPLVRAMMTDPPKSDEVHNCHTDQGAQCNGAKTGADAD